MPPKPPHQNHGGTAPKKKKPFYEDLQDGKYIADEIIDVVCKATSLCFDRGTSIPVLTTDYVRHLVKHAKDNSPEAKVSKEAKENSSFVEGGPRVLKDERFLAPLLVDNNHYVLRP